MRIGILTYHQSVNNGAVMQAYALSRRLKELYPACEVEIVDYRMNTVEKTYAYTLEQYLSSSSFRVKIRRCLDLIRDPQYLRRYRRRTEVFASCLDQLPLSPLCIRSDDLDEVSAYINERYDILVVGSDAIWNYLSRGFKNAYLPGDEIRTAKLSYAASCYGMDFFKAPDSEREIIRSSLNGFRFIGVRDNATEEFVRWSGSLTEPVHTCDPTVFLEVNKLPVNEDLLRQKLKRAGFDFKRPTIGIMGTDRMVKMVRRLFGRKYQIAALYEPVKGADVNPYDLTPYEWAYVFRYFKLTITTFFHGTLVSLRNGVPVVCIALNSEFAKVHMPKTLDILTRLGFADWYFETDYETKNIEAIKQRVEDFLAGDYKEQVLAALDREAESFEAFNMALKQLINVSRYKDND